MKFFITISFIAFSCSLFGQDESQFKLKHELGLSTSFFQNNVLSNGQNSNPYSLSYKLISHQLGLRIGAGATFSQNTIQEEGFADNQRDVDYTTDLRIGAEWRKPIKDRWLVYAGIDLIGNRMIVSDYATGEIIVYDISVIPAIEKGRISTSAQGIMGIKIGPEGKIWYIDYDANKVFRVDGNGLSLSESGNLTYNLYPNPSTGIINLSFDTKSNFDIEISNMIGQVVYVEQFDGSKTRLNLDLVSGTYTIRITDVENNSVSVKKLIIQ